jgi:hypothetical protein
MPEEIHAQSLRLAAARMAPNMAEPLDRYAGLEMPAQVEAHRTTLWEAVLLLENSATVAAAWEWRRTVWQLEQFACHHH